MRLSDQDCVFPDNLGLEVVELCRVYLERKHQPGVTAVCVCVPVQGAV